jgi:hypothetical protein
MSAHQQSRTEQSELSIQIQATLGHKALELSVESLMIGRTPTYERLSAVENDRGLEDEGDHGRRTPPVLASAPFITGRLSGSNTHARLPVRVDHDERVFRPGLPGSQREQR